MYPTVLHSAKNEVPDSCNRLAISTFFSTMRLNIILPSPILVFEKAAFQHIFLLKFYKHFLFYPLQLYFQLYICPFISFSLLKPCNYNKMYWNKTDKQHEWESYTLPELTFDNLRNSRLQQFSELPTKWDNKLFENRLELFLSRMILQ
jgi:hypothetical protein